jgi:microcin C transport system ATP-binding protein
MRVGSDISSTDPTTSVRESDAKRRPESTFGQSDDIPLLEVLNLRVEFYNRKSPVHAVRGISFAMRKGEAVAIVGESGSGKSVTALAVLQLLPIGKAVHVDGRVRFAGTDLIGAPKSTLSKVRGNRIGMVFQEPMASFNPLMTVGDQIIETIVVHQNLGTGTARKRMLEILELVGLPDAEQRSRSYPHQLSGGQLQRLMIGMALCNNPDLLIADEPTTALDVTIQAQIVELVAKLRQRLGMGLIWITHDLILVRKIAETVLVMHAGEIVERGPTRDVLDNPQHPYTKKLLAAEPKAESVVHRADANIVLEVRGLKVWFPKKTKILRRTTSHVKAVEGVDFCLRQGQTIGLVGESGSGKTTIGRAILRLNDSMGDIRFAGRSIQGLSRQEMRPLRRDIQIVFQDPYSSLNPRMRIAAVVGEGLRINRIGTTVEQARRVIEVLEEVGLDPESRFRYPHEFSGGQRQRIAIARAMIVKPRLVVLDEPTSALDRSVQSQIVSLLRDLQNRHGLAYLYISHDLSVVKAIAQEIIILRNGRIVEAGEARRVFEAPRHPYTRALFDAAFNLKADESGIISS